MDAWKLISTERRAPTGVLTDQFVMKFDRYLDWDLLSMNYYFTIDMLRIYFHKVNWAYIVMFQDFPEDFLREMAPSFEGCWALVSKYQVLSEAFIHDFRDKVDWEYIRTYQNVSDQFLEQHTEYFSDSDEE